MADRHEARWLARSAAQRLTAPAREVLAAASNGASMDEVANSLGISRRAAESHLLRARRVLRDALAAETAATG